MALNVFKKHIVNPKKRYFFINYSKYLPFNHIKVEEYINLMKSNPLVEFIENLSNEEVIKLINENVNNSYLFIFPFYTYYKYGGNAYIPFFNDMTFIINKIRNITYPIKLKVMFNTLDLAMGNINTTYLKSLLTTTNKFIHINLQSLNLDDMKNLKREFSYLKNTNIEYSLLNYSYKASQLLFNNNPIEKIALSGDIRNGVYTDRYKFNEIMKNYTNIYELLCYNKNEIGLKNNNFSKRLNKYLACFYASHDIYHLSTPLHKVLEILSCGSLLVIKEIDEHSCNLLGLFDKKHMFVIRNNDSLVERVKNILDSKNRDEINKIRKEGQLFCIENLDVKWLYNNMFSIFDRIMKK